MSITLTPDTIARLLKQSIRLHVEPETTVVFPNAPLGFERHTNHYGEGFMPLGAFSYTHSYAREVQEIGRYCSIGSGMKIIRNTHPLDRVSSSPVFYSPRKLREWGSPQSNKDLISGFTDESAPVTIGNDVWIGDDVRVRSGIHIATGSVVAAGSIVTRDVEPYSIVAGVPAKTIRYRFEKPLIEQLLVSEWWRYSPGDLLPFQTEDPVAFVNHMAIAVKTLTPVKEERFKLRQYLRAQ